MQTIVYSLQLDLLTIGQMQRFEKPPKLIARRYSGLVEWLATLIVTLVARLQKPIAGLAELIEMQIGRPVERLGPRFVKPVGRHRFAFGEALPPV